MEVTEYVNKLVRAEHGIPMTNESDRLVDTGCDSFGIVMVLLELENKYGIYAKEELKKLDIEGITLGSILERIANASTK